MSYCYDVMLRVFEDRIRPKLDDDELAYRFQDLIDAMHEANHQVPSADGVFKGDGINKAASVSRAARELDEYVKGPN
jgi:hypothetical protein